MISQNFPPLPSVVGTRGWTARRSQMHFGAGAAAAAAGAAGAAAAAARFFMQQSERPFVFVTFGTGRRPR